MRQQTLFCAFAQSLWLTTCLQRSLKFWHCAKRPVQNAQAGVLKEITDNSQFSEFGRFYKFSQIRNVKDFQRRVPVCDYEDMYPWIEKIADGAENVLTHEPVIMFEETSGTTSGSRLIPYTAGLQESFNRALHPWLFDLHRHLPQLWGGPSYWVVTPRVKARTSKGGVKIGFASDSDYFGSWARPFIKAIMAVPEADISQAQTVNWRYLTILQLLRQPDLRLISLWNPGFFTALMHSMAEWHERLEYDLRNGTCTDLAGAESKAVFAQMPERARVFEEATKCIANGEPGILSRLLWPRLALISGWSEAEAANAASNLMHYFTGVRFQTKGILATEGALTLPVFGAPAPVLAARSGFFEFEEGEEGSGEIRLAHELEKGGRYRVIMTNFAGLFRYRMHDIIEVKDWWHHLPCLRFVGKESTVIDLCGEKLNSAHVRNVLAAILGDPENAFVAPERNEDGLPPHYTAFVAQTPTDFMPASLAAKIDGALCENLHYRWCREAHQLGAVCVFRVGVNPERLAELRLKRLEEMKMPVSTAKLGVLNRLDGWRKWFEKELSAPEARDH